MDFEIFKPTKSKCDQRSIDFLTKPVESLGIHPISLVFSTHDPYNEWWAL
jgi:hypothetical protein